MFFQIKTNHKLLVEQHMAHERLNGLAIMSTERIIAVGVNKGHC